MKETELLSHQKLGACWGTLAQNIMLRKRTTDSFPKLTIVDEKDAILYSSLIEGTIKPEEKEILRKRKYYPFHVLLKKLYMPKSRKSFSQS